MSAPSVADIVTGTASHVSSLLEASGPAAAQLIARLKEFAATMSDAAVYGAFPLCLTLAILHEQYRSVAESTPFRVGALAVRVVVVVGAHLGFSYVVSLILRLAGGGSGGWMRWEAVGNLLGNDHLNPLYYDSTNVDITEPQTLGIFLLALGCWFIAVLSILFAYVAGMFLSLIQGAFLAIIIPVGPMCIMAGLVPGITVWKGWARSLAQVAAWSTLAGVITTILLDQSKLMDLQYAASRADCGGMIRGAARFLVYGLATWCVPLIAGKIMSGAAPAASAIGGAFAMGVMGARTVFGGAAAAVGGARDGAARGLGKAGAAVAGSGDHGVRPHKVGLVRGAVGAVVGAALAPVGMLVGRGKSPVALERGGRAEASPADGVKESPQKASVAGAADVPSSDVPQGAAVRGDDVHVVLTRPAGSVPDSTPGRRPEAGDQDVKRLGRERADGQDAGQGNNGERRLAAAKAPAPPVAQRVMLAASPVAQAGPKGGEAQRVVVGGAPPPGAQVAGAAVPEGGARAAAGAPAAERGVAHDNKPQAPSKDSASPTPLRRFDAPTPVVRVANRNVQPRAERSPGAGAQLLEQLRKESDNEEDT